MAKEIKVGDTFVCIKTVKMIGSKQVVYRKGYLYKSEKDKCITNDLKEKNHSWSEEYKMSKFFLKIKYENL